MPPTGRGGAAAGQFEPATATLRAARHYELVARERLSNAEGVLLGEPDAPGAAYGILRPRPGSTVPPRTATPDVALLFLTLAQPGPLPAYARAGMGRAAGDTVCRLVLDGILELEHRGEWVSGGPAAALLAGPALRGTAGQAGGRGRIGTLSVAALRYGQELAGLPEALLAQRLYSYGRRPLSPELRRRMPDRPAVATALGLTEGAAAHRVLGATWCEVTQRGGGPVYWRHWRARRPAGDARGRRANYKLYVSPGIEALPTAIEIVAELFAAAPSATAFKIGADLDGICRPDKFVAYFDRLDELQSVAAELTERLTGLAAHGVPFTAAVTDDGMLSWGADPPAGTAQQRPSWRSWVTQRLAAELRRGHEHEHHDCTLEPWRIALERVRIAGIDTDTWIPAAQFPGRN